MARLISEKQCPCSPDVLPAHENRRRCKSVFSSPEVLVGSCVGMGRARPGLRMDPLVLDVWSSVWHGMSRRKLT
jgi:hypothetical protein